MRNADGQKALWYRRGLSCFPKIGRCRTLKTDVCRSSRTIRSEYEATPVNPRVSNGVLGLTRLDVGQGNALLFSPIRQGLTDVFRAVACWAQMAGFVDFSCPSWRSALQQVSRNVLNSMLLSRLQRRPQAYLSRRGRWWHPLLLAYASGCPEGCLGFCR